MDQTRHDTSAHGAAHHGEDRSGEELRRLLDALAFRAEEYLLGLGHGTDAQADGGDAAIGERARHASSGTCDRCPLCAAMALLRGDRPELSARLSEHMAAFVTLLRRVLAEEGEAAAGNEQASAETAEDLSPDSADRTGSSKVQRIDVRRVGGNVLHPNGAGARAEGDGC
ncbi:hypothetical protein DFQ14_105192 [Halopolyspora algeriensis]|uniref:Uncharacterized protein n=1 Tax=Halopolyspora algeriensis TaxID=1500506 RepID=A0A368VU00_9ACTN|nr:hypothetical protein [Halopolyspora algeriensis]RCW44047.1 hypothetical protein DFQ14_105192 [Halopolyspora algeriensis]TQM53454.1 hypothetical protein FHU43_2854 [Halopolyspora algeriensis]